MDHRYTTYCSAFWSFFYYPVKLGSKEYRVCHFRVKSQDLPIWGYNVQIYKVVGKFCNFQKILESVAMLSINNGFEF